MIEGKQDTGLIRGKQARRYAALWYTNPKRRWTRWQSFLWHVALYSWHVKIFFDRTQGIYPYLLRATLIPRTRWTRPVYLHYGFSPDSEMEQHNHPWDAWSLILSGGYAEERGNRTVIMRRPRQVVRLCRGTFHRILSGGWFSLFVPGKRSSIPRELAWGFRDPQTLDYWSHVEYKRLKSGRLHP